MNSYHFGKRQRRPWMTLAGAALVVAVVPAWQLLPILLAPRPTAPRAQSNAALIGALAASDYEPGIWRELRDRLDAGQLNTRQVDLAIAQWTRNPTYRPTGGVHRRRPNWHKQFTELAVKKQAVSPLQFRRFCQVYFNKSVRLYDMHKAVRQGKLVRFEVTRGNSLELADTRFVCALRQVTIDGKPIKVVRRTDEQPPDPDELSGDGHGLATRMGFPAELEPGEYEVKFEFDVGVLPYSSPLVGYDGKPGQKPRWQKPLCTWAQTHTSKLRIVRRNQSPITLVTDPALAPGGPGGPGGVKVQRVYTEPNRPGVRIGVLKARIWPMPVPICARMKISFLDQQYEAENLFHNSGEHRIDLADPLPDEVDRITIILEPDPESAERYPKFDKIWGETITIKDVPVDRHDRRPPRRR